MNKPAPILRPALLCDGVFNCSACMSGHKRVQPDADGCYVCPKCQTRYKPRAKPTTLLLDAVPAVKAQVPA